MIETTFIHLIDEGLSIAVDLLPNNRLGFRGELDLTAEQRDLLTNKLDRMQNYLDAKYLKEEGMMEPDVVYMDYIVKTPVEYQFSENDFLHLLSMLLVVIIGNSLKKTIKPPFANNINLN